ncbi:MAG: magnesium transporter CorA family protein [Patescibacteria group bacterium]
MISVIHKPAGASDIERLNKLKPGTWIQIEEPTDEELKKVAEEFQLEESLFFDAMDMNELPRVEIEDNVLYIFTRYAYGHGTHILTAPMLIALNKESLITVSPKSFPRFERFISNKVEFDTDNLSVLLVKILRQVGVSYTNSLNTLGKRIFSISKNVERIKNKDIVQFVSYENTLYDINSALVRNDTIYRNILSGRVLKLNEDHMDLVEDLALENGQNMQVTKDVIRNLVNTREAYSTILTNNLNYVIKLFTSLTIVLTVPTIIGTLYGMNVPLPFASNPYAFAGIIITSILIMLAVVFIFIQKDWM